MAISIALKSPFDSTFNCEARLFVRGDCSVVVGKNGQRDATQTQLGKAAIDSEHCCFSAETLAELVGVKECNSEGANTVFRINGG